MTTICPGFVKTDMTAETKWMPWVLEVDVAADRKERAYEKATGLWAIGKEKLRLWPFPY